MFESWGYPAWFAFVIGASEMAGATLLLLPRLATYAAVFLAVIMLGALATDIVVGALGAGTPLFHLVALVIIAFSRRNQRRRPGPRSA
jgi:putative oxidoreductase